MVTPFNDYPSGFVFFAMQYEKEEDIEFAKEYCRKEGMTPENFAIQIKGSEEKMLIVVKK